MSSNYGQGSIASQNKAIPPAAPGPPFVPTSADNGLSVDPVTGRIVLGNDLAGTGAQLLNGREIDMSGQFIRLLDSVTTLSNTEFFGDSIQMYNSVNPSFGIFIGTSNAGSVIQIGADSVLGNPPRLELNDFSGAQNFFQTELFALEAVNGTDRMLSLDRQNAMYQMGDIDIDQTGIIFLIDSANGRATIQNNSSLARLQQWDISSLNSQIGDIDLASTGAIELIDITASTHDFSNTAGTALYSINGNPGVSGTFAPPASITVEGGIITAIS